ncbi:MAG: hypothetical protein NT062_37770 [Proteobacteria bacterium]|nr:hypothetical protein [Pseudomonadota bacterium]
MSTPCPRQARDVLDHAIDRPERPALDAVGRDGRHREQRERAQTEQPGEDRAGHPRLGHRLEQRQPQAPTQPGAAEVTDLKPRADPALVTLRRERGDHRLERHADERAQQAGDRDDRDQQRQGVLRHRGRGQHQHPERRRRDADQVPALGRQGGVHRGRPEPLEPLAEQRRRGQQRGLRDRQAVLGGEERQRDGDEPRAGAER